MSTAEVQPVPPSRISGAILQGGGEGIWGRRGWHGLGWWQERRQQVDPPLEGAVGVQPLFTGWGRLTFVWARDVFWLP